MLKYWSCGQPLAGADNNGALKYWIKGQPNGILAAGGDQNVGLGGLQAPRAFGTMVVAGPVTLPSIPSPRAFGTMVVTGGDQFVTLPSIHTPRKFGPMIVAGPITLPSIPSPARFGTMVVTQPQEVTLPSIVSPARFGTMTIAIVQSVTLPSIPSPRRFGTHTVAGPKRYMMLPSIPSPRRFGRLEVIGGTQKIRIYVAGVDRTPWLMPKTASFTSTQLGRWQANFDFYIDDSSWRPVAGQSVVINDFGRQLFVGSIYENAMDRAPKTLEKVIWHSIAIDNNGILDRRWIPTKTYEADVDAADIIRDIVLNNLDGEGLTTYHVPATLGEIGTRLEFNYDSVTSGFDRIRDITGCPWWVDQFLDLHFAPIDELTIAPFSIGQTSRNWRHLKAKDTLQGYANEIAVRTNRTQVVGGTAGAGDYEEFILPTQEQIDRGFVFGSIVLLKSFAQILEISVNDVVMDFKDGLDNSVNWSLFWWGFRDSPYIIPPQSGALIPDVGDVVKIRYIPSTLVGVGSSGRLVPEVPDDPLPPELQGTAGSGRYQSVIQVNDLERPEDLAKVQEAALERKNKIPQTIEFETDEVGAEVGMLLPVDLPKLYLADTNMMITSVSMVSMGVNTGKGSTMRSQIRAVAGAQDLSGWLKWFERFFRRTDHPLPIYQYETAEFILAPDGSLAAGVVGTNPNIVKRGGRLIEAMVAFTNPSVDQDVVLDIQADGSTLLLGPDKLVCPAGSTTLHVTTEFYQPAAFVFEKQLLLPVVEYRITGANPEAAANGTLILRWAI